MCTCDGLHLKWGLQLNKVVLELPELKIRTCHAVTPEDMVFSDKFILHFWKSMDEKTDNHLLKQTEQL